MNKTQNYNKGRKGEEIALKHMLEKEYTLLETNYENKLGEIDLIMNNKDILIFIEVKLKVGDKYGTPEEMINSFKLRQVKRVAESYLLLNPIIESKFQKYRIDAVCIVVDDLDNVERINHYENIY